MFEHGRVYRRNELHQAWDGTTEVQRQGGILTPVEGPIVIVVTGEEGSRYGYDDFWDEDGVFHYYGAGQLGPMEFVRGNLALRDHGEDVHLFEMLREGLRGRWCAPATTNATTCRIARATSAARLCSSSSRLTVGVR